MKALKAADPSFGALVADDLAADDEFREEWMRLAPARQFAVMLAGYRADHGLTQRELAAILGVPQPRVARMESGEQNPDFETVIATVRKLGTEFCFDVRAEGSEAKLIRQAARKTGAETSFDEVSVTVGSAA